jgi:hypothetical protein
MLEIQALKFARSMRRQVAHNPLIVYRAWADDWLRDLYDSFEKAQKAGKETKYFLEAEEAWVSARSEGRIVIREDDGSDSSDG